MINRYILWGLLGVVAAGLTHTGTSVGLKGGDWPAWVGAVGTVATLMGTIWLATAQTRQKARDDLTLARLHAAGMVNRLGYACSAIGKTCRTFETSLTTPIDLYIGHWLEIQKELSSIRLWNTSELVPMVTLPKNTAAKLAQAADELQTVIAEISQVIAQYDSMDHEKRENKTKFLLVLLRSVLEYTEEAATTCSAESGALNSEAR